MHLITDTILLPKVDLLIYFILYVSQRFRATQWLDTTHCSNMWTPALTVPRFHSRMILMLYILRINGLLCRERSAAARRCACTILLLMQGNGYS